MRYILIITAVVIFGFLFITSRKPIERKDKEIIIWQTYNDEEHRVFLEIVEKFQKLYPEIKIRVQRIPWAGHEQKLMVSMITKTAPDICRIDIGATPRFVKSRALLDLTPYGAMEIAKDLLPAPVSSNIYPECFFIPGSTSTEKRIFGFPDQTTGVVLFYNKKMFRKAGIKAPPKNWNEFVEVAKKLTMDINNDGKTDIYGFGLWGSLWWNFPILNTYGVEFLDETLSRCVFDSPQSVKALNFMRSLYELDIEAGAWKSGGINPEMGFINNLYAMIFMGQWNLKRFKEAKLDFGVALIPSGPYGTSTNLGGTNMVVLRETKYPKECYEFLKFLVSPEVQAHWANSLGQTPVNLKAYNLVDTSKMPELAVFMEQMKTAKPRPPVLDYSWLETGIFNPELYALLDGKKTTEDVIKEISRRIESEILSIH